MPAARIRELWVLPWLVGATGLVLLVLINELNPPQIQLLCDLPQTIGGPPPDCPNNYVWPASWLTTTISMAAFAALTWSMVRVVRTAARKLD